MKRIQTIIALLLISASSLCFSDNTQIKKNSTECQNAERAYRFVIDYRFSRPDEYQKKLNDVYKYCGYWPKSN